MFFAYIAQSLTTQKYYIGSTKDKDARLKRHNGGWTKSIKGKGPFMIIYFETFPSRTEAYRRERQIKSYKGGNAFKKLIKKLE